MALAQAGRLPSDSTTLATAAVGAGAAGAHHRRAASFVEGDVRDADLLARVFAQHPIDGVIHFAALKAVGESA